MSVGLFVLLAVSLSCSGESGVGYTYINIHALEELGLHSALLDCDGLHTTVLLEDRKALRDDVNVLLVLLSMAYLCNVVVGVASFLYTCPMNVCIYIHYDQCCTPPNSTAPLDWKSAQLTAWNNWDTLRRREPYFCC